VGAVPVDLRHRPVDGLQGPIGLEGPGDAEYRERHDHGNTGDPRDSALAVDSAAAGGHGREVGELKVRLDVGAHRAQP
jgi:hypothetical protein